jgi:Mg-chelatase subunit ChlI
LLTADAAASLASFAASVSQEGRLLSDEALLVRTHSVLDSLMRDDDPPSSSQAAQQVQQPQETLMQDGAQQEQQQQEQQQQEEDQQEQEGDAEMEEDVRAAIQTDAMASYDLDVQEEGEIIQTYSAMCASSRATLHLAM